MPTNYTTGSPMPIADLDGGLNDRQKAIIQSIRQWNIGLITENKALREIIRELTGCKPGDEALITVRQPDEDTLSPDRRAIDELGGDVCPDRDEDEDAVHRQIEESFERLGRQVSTWEEDQHQGDRDDRALGLGPDEEDRG